MLDLLNATLRRPSAVNGRITYIMIDEKPVPHAAIELTTVSMNDDQPATMTLVFDVAGLDQFADGLCQLSDELVGDVAQAERLHRD
jgi:hypothetical protein